MYAPIISVFPSKPNFHCLQFCTAPFVDYQILPAGCATTHDAPHWCQQHVYVSDEINCAKGLRNDDESRNSWKLPHNIPTVRAVKSCVFFAVLWKVVRASSECLRARAPIRCTHLRIRRLIFRVITRLARAPAMRQVRSQAIWLRLAII